MTAAARQQTAARRWAMRPRARLRSLILLALVPTLVGWSKPKPPSTKAERRHAESGQGSQTKSHKKITLQLARKARKRARLRSRMPKDDRQLLPFPDPAHDAARVPIVGHPSIQTVDGTPPLPMLGAWSRAQQRPALVDHRRRLAELPDAIDFGHTLKLGERFVYDIDFASNPVGMIDVRVDGIEPDARGPAPRGRPLKRLVANVNTSGVLALLASIQDTMTSWVDAETGASVRMHNVMVQDGFGAKYRDRETISDFEGRGHVRVVDTKDGKTRKVNLVVPRDTFDPISTVAWVRALNLKPGERASAHAMDMRTLMRVEVINRGTQKLEKMPPLADALGLEPGDLELYEGELTRVNRHDDAYTGSRVFNFRAYVGRPEPRILLALESDLFIGIVRLTLASYDPPIPTTRSRSAPLPTTVDPSAPPTSTAISDPPAQSGTNTDTEHQPN